MIYVLLAEGFEEIEALTPVDVLRRAGCNVKTAGISGMEITGAHSITVKCDICADEIDTDAEKIEMLILPGGMPGAKNIDTYCRIDKMIKAVLDCGGYVAAICAAPFIIGKRGYLCGKRAVCFPGFEDELKGAEISLDSVVRDGRMITSRCMGTALEFSIELVSCLKGEDVSKKLKRAIMAEG